ncbi:MAG: cell division protein FtsX [Alphaproteobacteria bacterium]
MHKKNDFLFTRDSSRFYFPWMCWLMVFIGTFICGGGMLVYNSLTGWQRGVSESLTVQINTYDEEGRDRGELVIQDVEKALSILRTTPGVIGASVLSDAQMNELMAPWVGADVAITSLPVPKLIDVAVDTAAPPFLEQLKVDLAAHVPGATMDSHRIWLAELVKLSHHILKLVIFVLALLALTIAFTVAYTTRSTLKIHESVIKLVHMMGAKDLFITNKYALLNSKYALTGGVLGSACALPLLWVVILFFKETSDTIFQTQFSPLQWGILGGFPFAVALLAFITTFKTVLSYLRRFL